MKFNFDRFWNESSPDFYTKAKAFVIAYTKWIKSVDVVDPMTVKVTLSAPNFQWLRQGLQSFGQPLIDQPGFECLGLSSLRVEKLDLLELLVQWVGNSMCWSNKAGVGEGGPISEI